MHVGELCRMGADIRVEGRKAIVHGVPFYKALCKSDRFKSGAALVLAGLTAHGVTEIGDLHHIDRGYDHLAGEVKRIGS